MSKISLAPAQGAAYVNNPAVDLLTMETYVNRPAFSVARDANVAITGGGGSYNTITMDTERYDNDSMWDSTDLSKVYIRTAG